MLSILLFVLFRERMGRVGESERENGEEGQRSKKKDEEKGRREIKRDEGRRKMDKEKEKEKEEEEDQN